MESNFIVILFMVVVAVVAEAGSTFKVHSSAFEDGKSIPTKYAYTYIPGGKNISVPLSWNGVPAETKSFALTIIDLHPIANNWVHWFVINILKNATALPESASGKSMPAGSKELYNSFGERGYGGPGPPKGSGTHKYEVTLYALNVEKLEVSENASLTAFRKVIEGKVIATVKVVGLYER